MSLLSSVSGIIDSVSKLTQDITNGLSLLGTLDAPSLSPFLTNNPLPNGYPWGIDNVVNTNPYTQAPDTGVTRQYEWNITRETLSPDGYEKQMIVVNSQFPGPMIEANWGDWIEVTVHNNIQEPSEGTSIHWHGFLMHHTPYMDGTPGLTQCPIPPGSSFKYSFRAELYGSSWYHAHYSEQYADGLAGPIVIHGPDHQPYDIDVGPVLLQDYFHASYRHIARSILVPRPNQPPVIPVSDNNLIDGKMASDCSDSKSSSTKCKEGAGISKFKFQSGKIHKLRLVNAGVQGAQQFSIDNHIMTVIANDFVPVKPYDTKVITLGVGQRTDVLVKADQQPNSFHWMRSSITCTQSANPVARAVVYYSECDNFEVIPDSQPWADFKADACANDDLSLTVPMYPIGISDPGLENTFIINMTVAQNESNYWFWSFNGVPYQSDYEYPTLLVAKDKENKSGYNTPENRHILRVPQQAKSYRIVLQNQNPSSHPIHLHGHNMYILSVSNEPTWSGRIVRSENPQRRDVQQIPANGHAVLQIDADNAGAWGFHCHMAFHSGSGLFMEFVEGTNEKLRNLHTPQEVTDGCKAWNQYRKSPAGQQEQSDMIQSGQ